MPNSEQPYAVVASMPPLSEQTQDPDLASNLASALWDCSALRHGMFTPPEFRGLCERIIRCRLAAINSTPNINVR